MSYTQNPITPDKGFIVSPKLYDRLKFLALVLLPALSTLYFTLGTIWGLPAIEQVIGSVAAIDTFLGLLLRISSNTYNSSAARYAGELNVVGREDGGQDFQLALNLQPEDLLTRKEIVFKVNPDRIPPEE